MGSGVGRGGASHGASSGVLQRRVDEVQLAFADVGLGCSGPCLEYLQNPFVSTEVVEGLALRRTGHRFSVVASLKVLGIVLNVASRARGFECASLTNNSPKLAKIVPSSANVGRQRPALAGVCAQNWAQFPPIVARWWTNDGSTLTKSAPCST